MNQTGANPALRAKLEAAKGGGASVLRPLGLDQALTRAIRQAGAPFEGLEPEVTVAAPVWDLELGDAIRGFAAPALISVLEAPSGARGLCLLENALVDALIEVQTTGRVDPAPAVARAITALDAALSRDFIGLLLAGFAAELEGEARVNWPLSLSYGAQLRDEKQVELLLPPGQFHHFEAELRLGAGAKTGKLQLFLPVTAAAMRLQTGPRVSPQPEDWAALWRAALGPAEVVLDARLLRMRLPLSRLEALEPGDVLEFDRGELAKVALVDDLGQCPTRGRLGCKGGKRALMLGGGAAAQPMANPAPSGMAPGPDLMPGPMAATGPMAASLPADPVGALPDDAGQEVAFEADPMLEGGADGAPDFMPQIEADQAVEDEDAFGLNSGPDVAAMLAQALDEG